MSHHTSQHSRTETLSTWTLVRDAVFPIYGSVEITKFLLLGLLKFFIIFVLTLTRDAKDTLIVTQCGAEAIAFLKVYGVLPAATIYLAIFAKFSTLLERRSLFYVTCLPFFGFFIFYDVILYPNVSNIEPSPATIRNLFSLGKEEGGSRQVIAKIMSHWTSALFYVIAEVFSSVSVGILFWKFANDIVPISQAKRFYPLFAYMSSFGPVMAGQYVVLYASRAHDFQQSMRRLTCAIAFSGMMICVLHHGIGVFVDRVEASNTFATTGSSSGATAMTLIKKKEKPKLSLNESIMFLSTSTYLYQVTILVLGYGLMYNFLEISWKSLVKKQYPDPLDYQRFMGSFSSLVGGTTLAVIFLGSNIIKRLGWRIGALTTPVVMSILAIPFFACTAILGGYSGTFDGKPNILSAAVRIGSIMILFSRTTKYGLFDPTVQMAYIPLDEESKVKGKAAIDVLGSRLGKSGASFVQQGLVAVFGNIIAASPVIMIIFYGVSGVWILAAHRLSILYARKSQEMMSNGKTL